MKDFLKYPKKGEQVEWNTSQYLQEWKDYSENLLHP